jgi:hypothetical protein
MNGLSLSPRFDQFKFVFPKDFLPKEVEEKYRRILSKEPGVVVTPIDYLNESIQSINIPGMSGLSIEQSQRETHKATPSLSKFGRIRVEPEHKVTYQSSGNPLEKLGKEFKVTFRMNQGLFNYFMIYETIFYRYAKPEEVRSYDPVFQVYILDEDGTAVSCILLKTLYIDGIDELNFNYNKVERDSNTFDVTFKFNNLDFDFVINGQLESEIEAKKKGIR